MNYLFAMFVAIPILFLQCSSPKKRTYQIGVSKELALHRSADISEVDYQLELIITDSLTQPIKAKAIIYLQKKDDLSPLVLDFSGNKKLVSEVLLNEEKVYYEIENEHLIIPQEYVNKGKNKIVISFLLQGAAVNRHKDYLYSLFVPDRARSAIPCFDQPDIKAKVSYSIQLPNSWTAITNGVKDFEETITKEVKHVTFESTKPISTYLWAFAVGKFHETTVQLNGIKVSLFHKENDLNKLKQNLKPVLDLVELSLSWMENYTGIPYPFKKYDLVCIPSFQFSGMEHPGAVYYSNEKMFLGENPTQKALLDRAHLIAHETAHMWFGNLVTMKWFGGVWQKEVFANFVADKIVKEQYPEMNHELNFLVNHFPPAYKVDRTKAANPIEQKLNNLKDASSLYGNIIYHKAPIVINQLEQLLGEKMFRTGLQQYLNRYKYNNATWEDLINILNELSEYDIKLWSKNWIHTPGRPVVRIDWEENTMVMKQNPEYSDSLIVWPQRINVLQKNSNGFFRQTVELLSAKQAIDSVKSDSVIPDVDILGYGLFLMDSVSVDYCFTNYSDLNGSAEKGVVLVNLYENYLEGRISSVLYFQRLLQFLNIEEGDAVLIKLILDQIYDVYWKFLSERNRNEYAEKLEKTIWNKYKFTEVLSLKKELIIMWSNVVITKRGLKRLKSIIQNKNQVKELKLSDRDICNMTLELTLRDDEKGESFVKKISHKINDEETKAMMQFLSPVFSNDELVLTRFVEDILNADIHKKEKWTLKAINYIHHPYLKEKNIKHLNSFLKTSKKLKETSSLFFPMRWIETSLKGYGSKEAIDIVYYYLKDNPDYPEDLKMKILQSLDMIKRKERILNVL